MSASSAAVLDALGDKTRRCILERVADGPVAVGVLADQLPISRPAVSQHLRVLKDAALVRIGRGHAAVYRVNQAGSIALRDYLDRFWAQALAGFKETVERLEGDES